MGLFKLSIGDLYPGHHFFNKVWMGKEMEQCLFHYTPT